MNLEEKIEALEKRVASLERINKRKRIMTIVSGISVFIVFVVIMIIYIYFIRNYLNNLNFIFK